MNKALKRQLKTTFTPPPPTGRDAFLRTLPYPKATYRDFLGSQLFAIRKRFWLFLLLLPGTVLVILRALPADGGLHNLVWMAASALPFLALVTVTELSRSGSCRMAELESSCRHRPGEVTLARMGLLGGLDLITALLLLWLLKGAVPYSLGRLALYLFVPFLLTCLLSMAALNYLRNGEAPMICGCAGCLVGLANLLLSSGIQTAYRPEVLWIWGALLLGAAILLPLQAHTLIKKLEEPEWNLQLTV